MATWNNISEGVAGCLGTGGWDRKILPTLDFSDMFRTSIY